MLIGIGCTVPEIVNLPGQSGGEEAALDYSLASACNNNSAFSPSQATPSGGVFSATPSGLNINSSTGEVTPVGSTPQAYTIAYTVGGSTSSFDLTIKPLDNATFSYSASSFPQDGSNPSPNFTSETITGGTFSATPSGLSINASTGEINLSASTVGSYTITYNTSTSGSSVCPNTSDVSLAVGAAALAQINNVYSMEFDALNDYIHVDDYVFSGLTSLSISCWYNLNSISGDQAILAQYIEAPTNRGILLYHDDPNGWAFYINTDAGLKSFESTFTATASVWQHLVVTYESGVGIKIYLNGTAQSSGILSGTTVNPTPSEFTIGRDGASGSFTRFLNGKLDELAVFNTALTAQDVSSIYNATETGKTADLNDLTTPPIKWYRMGD
jgi:hypothetical protein